MQTIWYVDVVDLVGLDTDEEKQPDPTHPALSDKERANYPEGLALVDTPAASDPSELATHLVHALHIQSGRGLNRINPATASVPVSPPTATAECTYALTPSRLSQDVATRTAKQAQMQHAHALKLTQVLGPLSQPNPTYLGTTSPSRLLATHAWVLATQIAPYVRTIVTSDLALEQTRLKLSNLISEGGSIIAGDKKKARTTRAARAALEGGHKGSTRRERWFRKELGYLDVLGTAGPEWLEAQGRVLAEMEMEREKSVNGEESRDKEAMSEDDVEI